MVHVHRRYMRHMSLHYDHTHISAFSSEVICGMADFFSLALQQKGWSKFMYLVLRPLIDCLVCGSNDRWFMFIIIPLPKRRQLFSLLSARLSILNRFNKSWYLWLYPAIILRARFCTHSICLACDAVSPAWNTGEQYSKMGLIYVVYTFISCSWGGLYRRIMYGR